MNTSEQELIDLFTGAAGARRQRENLNDPDAALGVRTLDLGDLLAIKIPPREFTLSPILHEKDLAMIYSWRGLGKTHLSILMAFAIASGGKCLNWTAPKPRKVLYVDGEMPAVTMQQRLANIIAGAPSEAELPAPGFFRIITPDAQDVSIPNLATREGQDLLDEKIGDAEVVFFDSISTLFRAGRENEAESWTPAQEWALRLRRRGVSAIFDHHEGKGGAQRGTSRREDVLDTVVHLVRPSDYRAIEGARFEIHFEKSRGLVGDAAKPFEARLEVRDDRAEWTMRDIEDVQLTRAKELFRLGMSVRDAAEELRISKSAAQRLRNKLKQDGELGDETK